MIDYRSAVVSSDLFASVFEDVANGDLWFRLLWLGVIQAILLGIIIDIIAEIYREKKERDGKRKKPPRKSDNAPGLPISLVGKDDKEGSEFSDGPAQGRGITLCIYRLVVNIRKKLSSVEAALLRRLSLNSRSLSGIGVDHSFKANSGISTRQYRVGRYFCVRF